MSKDKQKILYLAKTTYLGFGILLNTLPLGVVAVGLPSPSEVLFIEMVEAGVLL